MLVEAIHIIRELWRGQEYSHEGNYFMVRDARVYTLPEKLPPIYMAASGPESAELAGGISDGLISTTSGNEVVKAFQKWGGLGKPCFGSIKVCWAYSLEKAKEVMKKWWPVSAISGLLHIYIHQVGPDQEGFLKFFKSDLFPLLEKEELVKELV
jgi:coenzyme F420-dependent glucose-6-phosphate dehydrogenase